MFLGGALHPEDHGNSVLVKLKSTDKSLDKYIYAGSEVCSFTLPTSNPMQRYYSVIGNSSVPYPVAVSKDSCLMMLDRCEVPRSDMRRELVKSAKEKSPKRSKKSSESNSQAGW